MSQHIYLVNVTYNFEKNEIVCYFENDFKKIAKKYVFFPKLKFSKRVNLANLDELLFFYDIKNFKLVEKEDFYFLECKNIKDLKNIANLLAKLSLKKNLVLDPIRLFLIENDWSYFDRFKLKEDKLEKIDAFFDNPNLIFKEISFKEAKKINSNSTEFLVKKCVLSNLLKLPINKVPNDIYKIVEVFLENLYFKNVGYVLWENKKNFYSSNEFGPLGYFEKVSQIDFSSVWVKLLTKNFFNIGQETINCSCCKPVKLNDSNLLPSTLIEVIINQNNLFFETSSSIFRINFHKNNLFKKKCIEKKKEFWLKTIPIGPFFKNQKIKIPLLDAKTLLEEEKVILGKDHDIIWTCNKKESFISKNIEENLYILKNIDEKLKDLENNTLFVKDFNTEFLLTQKEVLTKIIYQIPFQLSNLNSSFFDANLASAIIFIQESILFKFNEFSEKTGHRVIYSNKKEVFVRGYSSLPLIKSFSNTLKLPMPAILGFSKIKKFAK